jgi:cytidine deaminase
LKSYSPYSETEETCLIKGRSGLYYPGVRIENISFPLTISAVQAAVCNCLANGDEPQSLYQNGPKSELREYWIDSLGLQFESELPGQIKLFNPVVNDIVDIAGKLEELSSRALTTHSDFPVSAILETDKGFVTGVNVEVSAWGLGLCAERVALSRAYSSGYTSYASMHIYAPKSEFCSPCGACRQVMNELMPDNIVELHHTKYSLSKHFIQHLLPYSIKSDALKKKK